MRPVTVLAAGGTIGMAGPQAVPALDAAALVGALPEPVRARGLRTRTLAQAPSVGLGLPEALAIARAAAAEAAEGRGVVVTHGTDTLEEIALLSDLVHAGEAPIAFTGAIRPASAPGWDGAANLADALAVAGAAEAAGLGAVVVFAGEVHAARAVRKVSATSPAAFASPGRGPVGRVVEGRVRIDRRPERRPVLEPARLDARVHVVPCGMGADGSLVDAAAAIADGLVAVVLGAGHAPPDFVAALARAAERLPVVATVRPESGAILRETYGYPGSERDLRTAGVVCAGVLSPAAARIKLLACLGAGLDRRAVAAAFAADDG